MAFTHALTTTETQHQVERGILLNAIILKSISALELLACRGRILLRFTSSVIVYSNPSPMVEADGYLYIQTIECV
jgi:hypothetical protein